MHIYIIYIFFCEIKIFNKKNTYHLNNEFFLSKLLNIKNLSVFNNKY